MKLLTERNGRSLFRMGHSAEGRGQRRGKEGFYSYIFLYLLIWRIKSRRILSARSAHAFGALSRTGLLYGFESYLRQGYIAPLDLSLGHEVTSPRRGEP